MVVALPTLTAAVPALRDSARTSGALRAAIVFRWQWRWRVPATQRLAAALARTPDNHELGVIAGHLERTRAERSVPAALAAPCYGIVGAGTVTAVTGQGERVTLTAGSTWDAAARLETCRRATLIHIGTAALH